MEDIKFISKKCFKCKNANCINDCPIHNNIPKILDLYNKEMYYESYLELINNNPLFFLCGATCDHYRNCGKNCLYRKVNNERIEIEKIEQDLYNRFRINYDFNNNTLNKSVAVIGSGPAGLASAILFRKAGYKVTVFEKEKSIGGVIKYLIPDFRFDKNILDELYNYLKEYIEFRFEVELGKDLFIDDLESFNHIIVACGTPLGIVELQSKNVFNGLDLLYKIYNNELDFSGKSVGVLGLGNVAVDVARVLKRRNADVEIIYRRNISNSKASIEELEMLKQEQIPVHELLSCVSFENSTAKFQKMKLGSEPLNGRLPFIKLDEYVDFHFDYLVEAYGSRPNIKYFDTLYPYNEFISKGYVNVNNIENVYFIGDYFTGPSSIVESINDSKKNVQKIINNDLVIDTINKEYSSLNIYYGGSFNPFTKAHLQIYLYLKSYLNNNVILVPNGDLYPTKDLLNFCDRINIINKSINNPLIDKSLNEIAFRGTVEFLRKNKHPLFVLGSDSIKTIKTWINYEDLVKENIFITFNRGDDNIKEYLLNDEFLKRYIDHFLIIDLDILNVSSTMFRQNKNKEILTKDAYNYIIDSNLYNS